MFNDVVFLSAASLRAIFSLREKLSPVSKQLLQMAGRALGLSGSRPGRRGSSFPAAPGVSQLPSNLNGLTEQFRGFGEILVHLIKTNLKLKIKK